MSQGGRGAGKKSHKKEKKLLTKNLIVNWIPRGDGKILAAVGGLKIGKQS